MEEKGASDGQMGVAENRDEMDACGSRKSATAGADGLASRIDTCQPKALRLAGETERVGTGSRPNAPTTCSVPVFAVVVWILGGAPGA